MLITAVSCQDECVAGTMHDLSSETGMYPAMAPWVPAGAWCSMRATESAKPLHPGDKLLLATRAVHQYMATIRSRASGTIRQVMYQLAKREFTSRDIGRHAIARSRKRRAGLRVIKTHDLIRGS